MIPERVRYNIESVAILYKLFVYLSMFVWSSDLFSFAFIIVDILVLIWKFSLGPFLLIALRGRSFFLPQIRDKATRMRMFKCQKNLPFFDELRMCWFLSLSISLRLAVILLWCWEISVRSVLVASVLSVRSSATSMGFSDFSPLISMFFLIFLC